MSADQTNSNSIHPLPGGGYCGAVADTSLLFPIALRAMDKAGTDSACFQLWADKPGVEVPTIHTIQVDRSGACRIISICRGAPAVNHGN